MDEHEHDDTLALHYHIIRPQRVYRVPADLPHRHWSILALPNQPKRDAATDTNASTSRSIICAPYAPGVHDATRSMEAWDTQALRHVHPGEFSTAVQVTGALGGYLETRSRTSSLSKSPTPRSFVHSLPRLKAAALEREDWSGWSVVPSPRTRFNISCATPRLRRGVWSIANARNAFTVWNGLECPHHDPALFHVAHGSWGWEVDVQV